MDPRSYPSGQGQAFRTYIPLLPYVKIPYERLDESLAINQKQHGEESSDANLFPSLIASTLANDVLKSGLARDSFVVRDGESSPPAHVLLTGELRSTEFDYYLTSYMLGAAGVLLWLLPIPAGGTTAHVDLKLSLLDTDRREIWSCDARGRSIEIFTLYNSEVASTFSRFRVNIHHFGRNSKGIDPDSVWSYHADALRSGMEPCRQSLAAFIADYKASPPVSFTALADQPEGASAEERLRKLKQLLDERLISPEDYQRKKALILDEL